MIHAISDIRIESFIIRSAFLKRQVIVDFYIRGLSENLHQNTYHLLLINDGQDLVKMSFDQIISDLYNQNEIKPLLCVGIHCGEDRKNEYGTVECPDYKGRGSKAGLYEQFIFKEVFPLINKNFKNCEFLSRAFCGFSLGGLSALNLVWRHSELFTIAGVFSGSLWWRSKPDDAPDFDEDQDRIMQQLIRKGKFAPGLKFFFETGTLDETADRNHNGIIDSIDDTLSMIGELENKGYSEKDIAYLEMKDGRHDVETWGRAFPDFLRWAYGKPQ